MFSHIFKLIRNNYRANILLIIGMLIISTVLWYSIDSLYCAWKIQQTPLGFGWEHVYHVKAGAIPENAPEWDDTPKDKHAITADFITLYNRIKAHPAVESACYTYWHTHYLWMNRSGQVAMSQDSIFKGTYIRMVSPSYFTVFRVKGSDGCSPEELTRRASMADIEANDIILTKNIANVLLGQDHKSSGNDIINKYVKEAGHWRDSIKVVAVCENQKYNEYTQHMAAVYHVHEFNKWNTTHYPGPDMFIRVKPNADHLDFAEKFKEEMKSQLRIGNFYLDIVEPMSKLRKDHLADDRSQIYTTIAIAIFFLINTFLVIFGTFWCRTQQRNEEFAVRIAMGASKSNIFKMLVSECLLLIMIAFIPSMALAYNLNNIVETYPISWSLERFLIGEGLTLMVLFIVSIISIWIPAKRAMKVQPAIALHGE